MSQFVDGGLLLVENRAKGVELCESVSELLSEGVEIGFELIESYC